MADIQVAKHPQNLQMTATIDWLQHLVASSAGTLLQPLLLDGLTQPLLLRSVDTASLVKAAKGESSTGSGCTSFRVCRRYHLSRGTNTIPHTPSTANLPSPQKHRPSRSRTLGSERHNVEARSNSRHQLHKHLRAACLDYSLLHGAGCFLANHLMLHHLAQERQIVSVIRMHDPRARMTQAFD